MALRFFLFYTRSTTFKDENFQRGVTTLSKCAIKIQDWKQVEQEDNLCKDVRKST
jgi:hypothetical protein